MSNDNGDTIVAVDETEEEIISQDVNEGGCCNFLISLLGRIMFRQGYIDLAVMPITAEHRRERLLGEWASYGVIMTLIAGFSVTIYMAPPQAQSGSPANVDELTAFGVCIILAAAMNFFGVLLTVAFYSSFNIVPLRYTKKWIKWHSWILGLPNVFLIVGMINFVAAMIIAARIIYTNGIFIFVCSLVGSLFIIFVLLYMFSPLAMARIRKGV